MKLITQKVFSFVAVLPTYGTNPRRTVFTLRPLPCERAPPGLGLSCPQPDANRPADWVRFLAPARGYPDGCSKKTVQFSKAKTPAYALPSH